MAERTHYVLGTAGHVDHGKTALVKALTGVDCDRLPEEKARGITIELGFARWDLGGGVGVSVVDVPGHERFVRTMTAGAAGIDAVLLVVAADDGVMPQTREHLAVCALLGVRAGVIAIAKADRVDAEMLQLVLLDVAEATKGTFLADAEIVTCSAKERTGLAELALAVRRALPKAARLPEGGPVFLAVDRVFSKPGAGAIATGTLVRGTLRVGDEIDALPTSGGGVARLKIRGLHVHDSAVREITAASRVAVNLRGEDEGALTRGSALASPDWQIPTSVAIAELSLLPSAAPLAKRTELVLHAGGSHRTIELTLLGRTTLAPGETAFVRIAAELPFPTYAGQKIVLRRPDLDAQRTIGGGHVVDPHATFVRGDRAFTEKNAAARVLALVVESRYRGIARSAIVRRMPPETDPHGVVEGLLRTRAIVEAAGLCFDAARRDEAKEAVKATLRAFHESRPILAGASPGEIETQSAIRLRNLVGAAIQELLGEGVLAQDAGLIRLSSHQAGTGKSDAGAKIASHYARAGLAPPADEEARAALGLTGPVFRDAMTELKRQGTLRQLTGGLHYEVVALHALKEKVALWFQTHKDLTPVDLKSLSGGLTRKHAIPLLEWLDSEGMTRRVGDVRVAGPRALVGGNQPAP